LQETSRKSNEIKAAVEAAATDINAARAAVQVWQVQETVIQAAMCRCMIAEYLKDRANAIIAEEGENAQPAGEKDITPKEVTRRCLSL
jgi:hypothetical protein